jgi:hypothetical protein
MPRWETSGVFMRFTIRDLFWLILVVAIAVGWWRNATPPDKYGRENRELRQRHAYLVKLLNDLWQIEVSDEPGFLTVSQKQGPHGQASW